MNKPWWLWEGAAVRVDGLIGSIMTYTELVMLNGVHWPIGKDIIKLITPIENPAVMLAPLWATLVQIMDNGKCRYFKTEGITAPTRSRDFHWPQCPDHLKGHTWELPHEKN